MSFKIVDYTLAADVADDGTATLAYPSGTNQAYFTGVNTASGHSVMINNNDEYLNADPGISITFGAGDITLTNLSGETWAAGSTLRVQLDRREKPGVGIGQWMFDIALAGVTAADVITAFTPKFAGTILAVDFHVTTAVTTAAKLASLNLEIGTVDVTGGVVALTSANATPKGVKVAGSTVTGANVFAATDNISIEASSVTAFVEGEGIIVITYRNDETANALDAA